MIRNYQLTNGVCRLVIFSLAMAGVMTGVAATPEEMYGEPDLKFILKSAAETSKVDKGMMNSGLNNSISWQFFVPESAALLKYDYGVTTEGYVSGSPYTPNRTAIDGGKILTLYLVGSDQERGSMTLHFDETAIEKYDGLRIEKVVLTYGLNGYSRNPVDVNINGVSVSVPYNLYDHIVAEFPECEPVSELTISTEAGKGVGFDDIYIYLAMPHADIKISEETGVGSSGDPVLKPYMKAVAENKYRLPSVKRSGDDFGEVDSQHVTYELEPLFEGGEWPEVVSENGDQFANIEVEGLYRLRASLKRESGNSGSVTQDIALYPSVDNFSLNWGSPLQDGFVVVPESAYDVDGDRMRTFKDAIASGYTDEAELYYKVTDDGLSVEMPKRNVRRGEETPVRSQDDIPDDFVKYGVKGIDLTTGNTLSVILGRNGAYSPVTTFKFVRGNSATTVMTPEMNPYGTTPRYYNLEGVELKKPERGKLYIEITPEGRGILRR